MTTRIPLDDATVPSRSQPVQTQTIDTPIDTPIDPADRTSVLTPRSERLASRRSRLPGLMAAALLGGAIAAVAVSSLYDERSLGTRIDDSVATARNSLQTGVQNATGAVGTAVGSATVDTVRAANRMAEAVDDAAISAKVRTALAADPALSALKIDVTTREGVVELTGPAPDERSRERAQVLAGAPEGVVRVDNRLVVSPPANSVPQV